MFEALRAAGSVLKAKWKKEAPEIGREVCKLCVTVLGDNVIAKPWLEAKKKGEEKADGKAASKAEEAYKTEQVRREEEALALQREILQAQRDILAELGRTRP